MSLVNRTIASVANRSGGTSSNKRFSRSLLATAAVVGGWLSVNLLAYGSLAFPSGGGDSLLVERSARSVDSPASAVSLPATPFFGVAAVETEAAPELDLANIPITQLNLVLSGVLSSSVNDRASALVSERGKPAERVYVGQTLPGGAEVFSVEVDHIILRRNGQMEKLTYPDADGRPTVPKQYADYTQQAARAVSARASADRSEKQQSIRERLEQLREMARQRQGDRSRH